MADLLTLSSKVDRYDVMMYRTTVRHKTVGNCELVLVAGGDGDISGLTNNKLLDFIVGGEDEDVEII